MEKITSRKNRYIAHLRALAADASYRRESGEFVCCGRKMLGEALSFGAEIVSVLWKEGGYGGEIACGEQYFAPAELFDYASSMKNSPGPLFTVRIAERDRRGAANAVVLENVQDPGNVGTLVRTASAFDIDAVVLVGSCADLYNPKTLQASMGAVFRQRVLRMEPGELRSWLEESSLPLYGAALSDGAADIRDLPLARAAVAVGSEGRGLSDGLLAMCVGRLIIPMEACSESLNAAVAGSLVMWEMYRKTAGRR